MTTYYTLDGRTLPESNIVKTYVKGTCDYKHTITCDRCCGRGVVHTYGVCYKCNGDCKVIKKSKGYTEEALKVEKLKRQQEENKLAIENEARKESQADNKIKAELKRKKAHQVQLLITVGGSSSDFVSSLASLYYQLLTGYQVSISAKQKEWAVKFLEKGCSIKDQPFDKISNYLDQF